MKIEQREYEVRLHRVLFERSYNVENVLRDYGDKALEEAGVNPAKPYKIISTSVRDNPRSYYGPHVLYIVSQEVRIPEKFIDSLESMRLRGKIRRIRARRLSWRWA